VGGGGGVLRALGVEEDMGHTSIRWVMTWVCSTVQSVQSVQYSTVQYSTVSTVQYCTSAAVCVFGVLLCWVCVGWHPTQRLCEGVLPALGVEGDLAHTSIRCVVTQCCSQGLQRDVKQAEAAAFVCVCLEGRGRGGSGWVHVSCRSWLVSKSCHMHT
jgi:hypothetical protein